MLQARIRPRQLYVWPILGVYLLLLLTAFAPQKTVQAAAQAETIGEGVDFATLELDDPWDMDSFYDISNWINHAGDANLLADIQVADGVFSARATGNYSEFYLLFPGYEPGLYEPNFGVLHPINSSEYACVYLTMKVDVDTNRDYYFNLGWVEDKTIDWGSSAWGRTYGNKIVPNQWVTYKIPLATWPYQAGDHWNSLPEWQGLRVTPIFDRPNTKFAVDWVRLTNCQPVNYTISGLSSGTYSLWLGAGNPERKIRYVESFSPNNKGQYTLDTQGIAAGHYNLYVKNSANQFTFIGQLNVDGAPIPVFTHPSPLTGEDYSTLAGNPWDMSSNADIDRTYCVNWTTRDGILNLETLSPSSLPSDCYGGVPEADPVIYLNTPASVDIRDYRYLSFRHYIEGAWSAPEEGMVVRWIWRVQHPSTPNGYCEYVSREIMLDVGWKTYWIDLHDPWNGSAVQVGTAGSPLCDKNIDWKDQSNALLYFRIDPNENTWASSMHQKFDWIRLTKVPSIQRGNKFPIQISMNEDPYSLSSISFYYTDDPNQPTQMPVQSASANSEQAQPAPDAQIDSPRLLLPIVMTNYAAPYQPPPVENEVLFWWDTGSVNPGTYYLCVVADDGYNQTTFCSDAPVQVLP